MGRKLEPSADIVVGLGWGDESKGATVDALVAHTKADRVVRFNGGQQAAHNVIANGVHHTFSSYGSGTMSGVDTWISHYCTVDPLAIVKECNALANKKFSPKLYADRECLVTTPIHVAVNKAREAINGHGTTGTGFGETIYYAIEHEALRVGDLLYIGLVIDHLTELSNFYSDLGLISKVSSQDILKMARDLGECRYSFGAFYSDELLNTLQKGHTVFEGAQGFVLDENFGFNPHTTWSTTTPANARKLLRQAGVENVRSIGCLRTYATRHGNGPFPNENALPFVPDEPHNRSDNAQGMFRTGLHDPEIVKWAIDMTGVDSLSVSHYDVFSEFQTSGAMELNKPIIMKAHGPRREDRIIL